MLADVGFIESLFYQGNIANAVASDRDQQIVQPYLGLIALCSSRRTNILNVFKAKLSDSHILAADEQRLAF